MKQLGIFLLGFVFGMSAGATLWDWVNQNEHRLADAEPVTQPDDAPRDDNGDPKFDEH